jgi:toxin ParE1/3/4
MSRFKLSDPAGEDLRDIRDYISRDSVAAARRVIAQLREAFRGLAQMPGKGHVRDDLSSRPLRFWPVGSYLVVYDPKRRPLEIVRVLHGARDIDAILREQ